MGEKEIDYTIDECRAIAMGRFGLSYEDTKTLTLYEFALYGIAYQIKKQDERLNASFVAWQNQAVQKTKGSGKNIRSAYKNFSDFYDSKEDYKNIFLPKTESAPSLAEINRRINQGGKTE